MGDQDDNGGCHDADGFFSHWSNIPNRQQLWYLDEFDVMQFMMINADLLEEGLGLEPISITRAAVGI